MADALALHRGHKKETTMAHPTSADVAHKLEPTEPASEGSSKASVETARPETVQVATTQKIELARVPTRRERDLLGEADVLADDYWGVHTLRTVESFPITGVSTDRKRTRLNSSQ